MTSSAADKLQAAARTVAQPITFSNGVTAPNRILKSAMTERLCTWSDTDVDARGKPTPEYIRLYEEWGKGGIGITVLGNIPVDRRFPECKGNAILDSENSWDPVPLFKPVVAAVKANGSLCIGQITHGGRQTAKDIVKVPLSASDVKSRPLGGMAFGKPRPMTIAEIEDVVRRFGWAAKKLYEAGADGCQLHAAHGYLLSQFLSPLTNKRTDNYGGSFDNRARIVFDSIAEVRRQVPDEKFMITIKINSADFNEGGFNEEDSLEMCKRLEAAGVTLIELSGGTYETMSMAGDEDETKAESTRKREAFFLEFSARFAPHIHSAKLAVTGGFRSLEGMAQALNDKSCDIVGIARPLTADTAAAKKLIEGETRRVKPNYVWGRLSTVASYLQIYEIGHGQPVTDYSDRNTAATVEATIMLDPKSAIKSRPIVKNGLVYKIILALMRRMRGILVPAARWLMAKGLI